jgi:hypothetical protein
MLILPVLPDKDHLDAIKTLFGISGTLFVAGKTIVIRSLERSFQRRIDKCLKQIESLVDRLRKIKLSQDTTQGVDIEPYRSKLTEDLRETVRKLSILKDQVAARIKRQREMPRGIRSWLLLYKPAGLDGWISQSLFYTCLFFSGLLLFDQPWDFGKE